MRWLEGRGYRILERNFSCRSGELDVIAEQGGVLCFVEIKARGDRSFGSAIEALHAAKKRRIARAAAHYLARHPTEKPCRFDVLAMDLEDGEWRYTLVADAFSL